LKNKFVFNALYMNLPKRMRAYLLIGIEDFWDILYGNFVFVLQPPISVLVLVVKKECKLCWLAIIPSLSSDILFYKIFLYMLLIHVHENEFLKYFFNCCAHFSNVYSWFMDAGRTWGWLNF
jgi:hypothetical protein